MFIGICVTIVTVFNRSSIVACLSNNNNSKFMLQFVYVKRHRIILNVVRDSLGNIPDMDGETSGNLVFKI